ncbi:MAG: hypothetical protein LBL86_06535 [Coriobacteriales bacterium]|jgi:hypothetical protein|nr:hypothetical protein [Coriobacteriales bacterium]
MLDKQGAFVLVHDELVKYYEGTENPYVGLVLADMAPEAYRDESGRDCFGSFDPALFDEWGKEWGQTVGDGEEASNGQILRLATPILKYYSDEVGYDLTGAQAFPEDSLGFEQ